MKKQLFIGLMAINFIIIVSAIFLIIRVSDLPKKIENLILSESISQVALQFNVENFHTQLEMWEYAYNPNDVRLEAFESHNAALSTDLEEFAVLTSNNQGALYKDGLVHSEKIISDLHQIQEDWKYLLLSIKNYRQIFESNASDEEIKQAKNAMDALIFSNEDLFDRLEFNKEVENFTTAQSEYTIGLKNEISSLMTFSKIGILVLYTLLIIGIFVTSIFFFKIGKRILTK